MPKNFPRCVPRKLSRAGYQSVQADKDAVDGRWRVGGSRVVIYGRTDVPMKDRLDAASKLVKELFMSGVEQRKARRTKAQKGK